MAAQWDSLACADSPLVGLQGNDLQQERDSRGSEGLYMMDSMEQSSYANVDNLEACSTYLANTLAGLGMPAKLDFLSHRPEAVVGIVNCMHSLVRQRQADREAREQLEAAVRKLRFESQVIQSERSKLEDQLKEKYTELGTLEIKVRQAERVTREASSEACTRADKASRQLKQLQASLQQADVRVRQRDMEIASLKQRLTSVLAKRGSAGGPDATTCSSEAGGDAEAGGSRSAPGSAHTGQGVSSWGGAGEGARRLPRNAQSSLVAVLQQELDKSKKQADASDKRAAALASDNAALCMQLTDLRHDFTQLLQRCNSLSLGVSPSEVASLQQQPGTTTTTTSSSTAAREAQAGGGKAGAGVLSDTELRKYMATDLKVVQARCQQLLKKAPGTGNGSAGGSSQAVGGGDAGSQQHLNTVMAVMADQDKALTRALTSLKRAEAQRDAAQQRAAATQQRVLLLEKRLTEACAASNSQQEAVAHLQQRCQGLEAQVQHLEQQLGQQQHGVGLYEVAPASFHHDGSVYGHDLQQPQEDRGDTEGLHTGGSMEHWTGGCSVDLAQGWPGRGAGYEPESPARMPAAVGLGTAQSPLLASGLPCAPPVPAQEPQLSVDVRASYEDDLPWGTPASMRLDGLEQQLSQTRPARKTWVIPAEDTTPSPREMLQQAAPGPDWD